MMKQTTRRRIVGIGSHHGDDRAAWQLLEQLRGLDLANVDLLTVDEPSRLLDNLDDCDQLFLIDACRSSALPGTVSRLSWPDERIASLQSRSTHSLGIGEVLQLAEQLGQLPDEVILFGIELVECAPGAMLSAEAQAGVDRAAAQILADLESQARLQPKKGL